jgi:hypothetical protein
MEDIGEGFIKGRVCTFHCIFITSVVKYGRIEQSVRITQGREKNVHQLLMENLKERDCCLLQLTPCRRVLFKKLIFRQLVKKFPTFYETWRGTPPLTSDWPGPLFPTTLFPYKYGQFPACPHSHFITRWRWNRQCSETSAFNTQTPGKYSEDNM